MKAVLAVFLVLFTGNSLFPQAVIKEKVEITPKQSFTLSSFTYNGCTYNFYDSTEVNLNFSSGEIELGDTTTFQLLIYGYPYNDDGLDEVQKLITVEPNLGEITDIGNGEYQFVAPTEIYGNSITLNINYDNYWQGCADCNIILKDPKTFRKAILSNAVIPGYKSIATGNCLNCIPGAPALIHLYGNGQITVINNTQHLYAYFENDELTTGDTTNIIIKNVDSLGNESDFPDTTHFEIGIKEGCGLGRILDVNGNMASYFSSIQSPIRFVASDSIAADSAIVVLRVGVTALNISSQGSSGQMIATQKLSNTKNTLSKSVTSTKHNSSKFKNITDDSYCTINNYNDEDFTFAEADIKSKLEIIYPKIGTNETIKAAAMPTVVCKARLKNYNKGAVRFVWEYGISYGLNRENHCSRTGYIMFQGTSYSNNSDVTQWSVTFTKDSIKYISLVGEEYLNSNYCTYVNSEWDEENNVFIGGDTVFVGVIAYDINGNIIGQNSIIPGKFLGANPNKSDIKTYNSDREIWAIIQKESSWRQFNTINSSNGYNNAGMPIYGPPSGFGLMQLDNGPYATETDLWNWQSNVDDGAKRFDLAKINALTHLEKIYQEVPLDIILIDAFQNYNGGHYYKAHDYKNDIWMPYPYRNKKSYGIVVYGIYTNPSL
jgi:hypothetical protein